MRDARAGTGPRTGGRLRPLSRLPFVAALLLLGCAKDWTFFSPLLRDPFVPLVDLVPPVITDLQPPTDVPLNDQWICYVTMDPDPANGQPVSGINLAGMSATAGGTALPITPAGASNTFLINITSLNEGPNSVLVSVPDLAGNTATRLISFRKDVTPPVINAQIPTTGSTDQPTFLLPISGSITDTWGLSASQLYVQQAVNGACDPAGPLFPSGSGAGQVSQNSFDLSGSASGFNLMLTKTGAPDAMRPRTTLYCFQFLASDQAVRKDNTPNANTSSTFYPLTFTWQPMLPPPPGGISGHVTLNGTGLAGVVVSTGTAQTTTASDGSYSFSGLPPGPYQVSISNLPSNAQCPEVSKPAAVASGQVTVVDFACTVAPGGISGRVTVNGAGVAGVTVFTGPLMTTTASDGSYSFPGLAPGQYQVSISNLPAGAQCPETTKPATVVSNATTVVDFPCTLQDFFVTGILTYLHIGPGSSKTCVGFGTVLAPRVIGGEPVPDVAHAGAPYTVTWTGPGTVGPTQRSGNLNASGQGSDSQPINAFGTYNVTVSVTSNGLTRMFQGNISVGPTQGTCPP